MPAPAISVLMPVWNGEAHLREAVESILNQTFTDFEFLVLDDGSTDRTLEILSEYAKDPRLRVIRLEHGGIVKALNRGIEEARADWIGRMDCDDVSLPQRLEKQWEAVSTRPGAVLCHTQIEIFGEKEFFPPKVQYLPRSQPMLKIRLCLHCPISHPSVLLRKSALLKAGGYLPEQRHAEDYGLWERMLPLGEFVAVPEPLLKFRVHGGSISKQAASIQDALTRSIRARLLANLFQQDSAQAEVLLAGITRGGPGPFTPLQALALLKLLSKHRLLNLETALWLTLNSLRAARYKPASVS